RTPRLTARQVAESWLLAAALVGACALAFVCPAGSTLSIYPVHYLVIPFVAWGAVRFGPCGSSAAVLVTAIIAVASTVEGMGPFAQRGSAALLLLQMFLGVLALAGLLLGAAVSERNTILERLALTQARLRLALS